MRLKNILIVVKDIEASKKYYHDLFGLNMILDNDGNMILTEGLVLQEEKYWKQFLDADIIPKNNHAELYFEERNIEEFVEKLERLYPDPEYVNRLMIHSWGQQVIRFYDLDGNFLGTDDNGLQGEAFFMESTDFEQGMDPSVARRLNRGFESLKSNAAKERYEKHYNNLSTRPDWDGKLTLEEANDWYRNGNGQPLFVSLEKIDLSGLVSLGESFVGQEKVVSLKWASSSINDALVYGKITLKRYPNHRVRAYADNYNFDVKPWRNPLNWTRNIATKIGGLVAGEGIEYEINIYGSQKLLPILPWIK